jgi:hypothetical protein
MKKSTRILVLLIAVETLILGGGFWLASALQAGSIGYGGPNGEAALRTFEMMGMISVPLALVFGLLYISARRKGE